MARESQQQAQRNDSHAVCGGRTLTFTSRIATRTCENPSTLTRSITPAVALPSTSADYIHRSALQDFQQQSLGHNSSVGAPYATRSTGVHNPARAYSASYRAHSGPKGTVSPPHHARGSRNREGSAMRALAICGMRQSEYGIRDGRCDGEACGRGCSALDLSRRWWYIQHLPCEACLLRGEELREAHDRDGR